MLIVMSVTIFLKIPKAQALLFYRNFLSETQSAETKHEFSFKHNVVVYYLALRLLYCGLL